MVDIREINQQDAEGFLALMHQLDNETQFMMMEPNERTSSVQDQRRIINEIKGQPNSILLIAQSQNKPVGFIQAEGGTYNRNKHSAYIVIGIIREFCGKGIGQMLFSEMESRAKEKKIHRLELTVMTHNQAALTLYQKMGFQIEGIKKNSLKVNNSYVDEYYMAKLI